MSNGMIQYSILLPLLLLFGGTSAFSHVQSFASLRFTSSVSSTLSPLKAMKGVQQDATILQGKSPKVVRLRKSLEELWTTHRASDAPIVIMGEKGCGKESIVEEVLQRLPKATAEQVHRLSLDDAASFINATLGTNDTEGLLDKLSTQTHTTLVLKGFGSRTTFSQDEFQRRQEIEETVNKLITEKAFYSRHQDRVKDFQPRIIYSIHTTTPQEEPDFVKKANRNNQNSSILSVKVPSLESRTQDMALIAQAKVQGLEREYDLRNVRLTPQATKRLLDHTWTGQGEPELELELRKALLRLSLDKKKRHPYLTDSPSSPWRLEARHVLPNDSMRSRLLYNFPLLRDMIQSPWVFDHTLRYIVTPVFVAFLAVLFLGPQTREQSAALTVFWAGWWPLVMLSFPFLGRIWCSICPFMAVGNLAQEAATSMGVPLKRWPKWVNTVGAPFAFGLFFVILCWEELWDLPQNGALSAWLLLLITSGAVFNSVQFEKRMWCRHLCPIGAMCRTFGTMSIVEVRAFKANCQCCTNPQCVNGDSPVPDPSDKFALKGCTMDLKINQLRDMGHCTLCMSCVKNCEKETPEVNARPIGIDYGLPWLIPPAFQDPKNMAISQVETNFWMGALLTILQGSVFLHYMPRILYDFGMDPKLALASPALDSGFYVHSLATIALLALPGLLSLLVDEIAVPLENTLVSLRRAWGKPDAEKERERNIIISAYKTMLRSDMSLLDTFKELDPDGDGTVASWELERELRNLQLPETHCEDLMRLIRRRLGKQPVDSLPTDAFLDAFQQLYFEARGSDDSSPKKVQLETTKTFVELFNDLDKDGDGFIMPGDFDYLIDRDFQIRRSWEEKLELFRSADVIGQGRLNLFEFMTMMRKIAQAGIQEIGYGYLPLAWASLTAYWLGLGMKELGLTLQRAPSTFYLDQLFPFDLPGVVTSDSAVALAQAVLVVGALPISIGLTQKLCQDSKIGGLRFGLHAGLQAVGAWITVYLMLSSNPLAT